MSTSKVLSLSRWWGAVVIEKMATPIGVALFLAGTAIAMLEVLRRYVFNVSFLWQQDFVVVALLSGTAMFFIVVQWSRGHIAVTALAEFLNRKGHATPRRVRAVRLMNAVADTWTGVYLALMLYWGIPLLSEYHHLGIRMASQAFAFWPFWLFFLFGLALLAFTCFLHAYQGFRAQELGATEEEADDGHG